MLEAMEGSGMEQVKTEKGREAKTELTHASNGKIMGLTQRHVQPVKLGQTS